MIVTKFAPARGRGLKRLRTRPRRRPQRVRPRAGAWIETMRPWRFSSCPTFAPARGRGLKHHFAVRDRRDFQRSPPRGGVD